MWRRMLCCKAPPPEEAAEYQELNYSHKGLVEVPPEIFNYERTLEKLDLSSNQITDLPRNLFHCHELKELILFDNHIKTLPHAVSSFTRLVKLNISHNGISDIPASIKSCKHLTYLNITGNPFMRLSNEFFQLVNLEEFILNDTQLEFFPANFGRLTKLKSVEARSNFLLSLPKSMGRLSQLEKLNVGANDINALPECISSMHNLMELYCDSNAITEIPEFIGNLLKLTCLDASKNNIKTVHPAIGKCINLTDLSLNFNCLEAPLDGLPKLKNVITVRLDNNRLEELPADIGQMHKLEELNLSNNTKLKKLPPEIGLLRNLNTLYLDNDNIEQLPKEIGSCTSLTILSVSNNKLREIPAEVGHLKNLKVLNLINNSINHLPVSMLSLDKLGALWLTETQGKPEVPALSRELDAETGQYVVTCCLLPQLRLTDEERLLEDQRSRHLSDGEQRRSVRTIRFKLDADKPAPKPVVNGGLTRAPTPYPKDMNEMARRAAQIRSTKTTTCIQNEPMYEGETLETTDHGQGKGENATAPHTQIPLGHETSSENLNSQKIEEKVQPKEMPENLSEAVPSFELELACSSSFGKSPPPYHIAAQRAAFLRSSGGAGSGRTVLSNDVESVETNVKEKNNVQAVSANRIVADPLMPHRGTSCMQLVANNVEENLNLKPSAGEPLVGMRSDKNANTLRTSIPERETEFNVSAAEPANNLSLKRSPGRTSIPTVTASQIESESRIPRVQKKLSEMPRHDHSVINSRESRSTFAYSGGRIADAKSPPVLDQPSIQTGSNNAWESPGNHQYQQRLIPSAAFKPIHIYEEGKFEASLNYPVSPSSLTLGNTNASRPTTTHGLPPRTQQSPYQGRGSSRIPKREASKIPSESGVQLNMLPPKPGGKGFIRDSSRSSIPKPSGSSGQNVTDNSGLIMRGEKPWMFGSHRNAQVVSVEYRKPGFNDIGITLVDSRGGGETHREAGVYVSAKDPEVPEINVGDRIMQVDGIDCLEMPAKIVSTVFGNCKGSVLVLVSRQ